MKKLTVVAFALFAAGAAMAEGLTREQVVAELQRARASGELQAAHSENPDFFGSAQVTLFAKKKGSGDAALAKKAEPAGKASTPQAQ